MDIKTRDIIYNKNAANIEKSDIVFYKKLLAKRLSEVSKLWGGLSVAFVSFVYSLSILSLTCGGIALSLAFAGAAAIGLNCLFSIGEIKLKELGLTKKEWKELKKSGRLKEISYLVEESANLDRLKLEVLQEQRIKLEKELELNREEKNKLLSKLLKQKQTKKEQIASKKKSNKQSEQECESDFEIGL